MRDEGCIAAAGRGDKNVVIMDVGGTQVCVDNRSGGDQGKSYDHSNLTNKFAEDRKDTWEDSLVGVTEKYLESILNHYDPPSNHDNPADSLWGQYKAGDKSVYNRETRLPDFSKIRGKGKDATEQAENRQKNIDKAEKEGKNNDKAREEATPVLKKITDEVLNADADDIQGKTEISGRASKWNYIAPIKLADCGMEVAEHTQSTGGSGGTSGGGSGGGSGSTGVIIDGVPVVSGCEDAGGGSGGSGGSGGTSGGAAGVAGGPFSKSNLYDYEKHNMEGDAKASVEDVFEKIDSEKEVGELPDESSFYDGGDSVPEAGDGGTSGGGGNEDGGGGNEDGGGSEP